MTKDKITALFLTLLIAASVPYMYLTEHLPYTPRLFNVSKLNKTIDNESLLKINNLYDFFNGHENSFFDLSNGVKVLISRRLDNGFDIWVKKIKFKNNDSDITINFLAGLENKQKRKQEERLTEFFRGFFCQGKSDLFIHSPVGVELIVRGFVGFNYIAERPEVPPPQLML